jgi:exopolysaccharide biosynthesis polyprenyl glycosylphosphotransferase
MKRVLYIIIDLLIIYGSITLTFYILECKDMLQNYYENFEAFKTVTPFIWMLYLILMYAFGLYNTSLKSFTDLIYTVFLISICLIIGIMGICFFVRDIAFAFPRSVILLSALFYFVFLSLWRLSLWYIDRILHGVKNVMIIGDDYDKLKEIIDQKYSFRYHVEYLCSENDLRLSWKIKSVDEIFVCSDVSHAMKERIIPLCNKYKKNVHFVPNYFDLSIMSSSLQKMDDIPIFRISNMELSPEESFLKRVIDLVLGSIALIIALPVGLITALLVKLDRGPVFYAQERLTNGGKKFKILKFRTMIPNAENLSGPILAGENDPRITKIGRIIRAIRLDEIPQLLNILKGDMSIVGPRPERPFFAQQFDKEIPEYPYRLKVKAGLTGLAQVEGKYNTSVEDKLRYDLLYINNYSILKDILIMLRTVKILFMKESTEGVISSTEKLRDERMIRIPKIYEEVIG